MFSGNYQNSAIALTKSFSVDVSVYDFAFYSGRLSHNTGVLLRLVGAPVFAVTYLVTMYENRCMVLCVYS